MVNLLGLLLFSFVMTSVCIVPFIDLLFYLKRRFEREEFGKIVESKTPIHDKLMKDDIDTPSGGGILLVLMLVLISTVYVFINRDLNLIHFGILTFTAVSFGFLGFVDDVKLILTKRRGKFFGLGRKTIFLIQFSIAFLIAGALYFYAGFNNIYITGLGNFVIDYWYIPLAAFIIVAFANAYNISDGLDGLSTGLLLICLFAFLALASTTLNLTIASFIGIWIGILIAYLYFNIWPARIFLGDAGAFAFGATLAVVGLLSAKIISLMIIGGVFVVIAASSLLQILSKKILKRRILPVAPLHMYFRYIGWEEPKIVTRFWLAQAIFAIFGLWIALLSK